MRFWFLPHSLLPVLLLAIPFVLPACLRLEVTVPGRSRPASADARAPARVDAGGGFVAEHAIIVALGEARFTFRVSP